MVFFLAVFLKAIVHLGNYTVMDKLSVFGSMAVFQVGKTLMVFVQLHDYSILVAKIKYVRTSYTMNASAVTNINTLIARI